MIQERLSPAKMRKLEAAQAARRIHDAIEGRHATAGKGQIRIDARTRTGRVRGLRALASDAGPCSLGAAHDASCRIGHWAYLSTMNSRSLYKGIGVVANAINFETRPARDEAGFAVESGLEVLIDLHILKRLALRAGAPDAESQIAMLRPVIAWCAAANQCGITGRFIVPTADGLYFCRREELPDIEGRTDGQLAARVVTFYSFDEMRNSHKESWARLRDAGILDNTPSYPRLAGAGKSELVQLCAMAGEDLLIRTALEAKSSRKI